MNIIKSSIKLIEELTIYSNVKLNEEQTTLFASCIADDIQLFVKEHQSEFDQYLSTLNSIKESIISLSTKYINKFLNDYSTEVRV